MANKTKLSQILADFDLSTDTGREQCIAKINSTIKPHDLVGVCNIWDIYQLAHLVDKDNVIWNNLTNENYLIQSLIDHCYAVANDPDKVDPFNSTESKIHADYRQYQLINNQKNFINNSLYDTWGENNWLDKATKNEIRHLSNCIPTIDTSLKILAQKRRDKVDRIVSTVIFPIGIIRWAISHLINGHGRFWESTSVAKHEKSKPILHAFSSHLSKLEKERFTKTPKISIIVTAPDRTQSQPLENSTDLTLKVANSPIHTRLRSRRNGVANINAHETSPLLTQKSLRS